MGDEIPIKAPSKGGKRLRKKISKAAAAKRWQKFHETKETMGADGDASTSQPSCADDVQM